MAILKRNILQVVRCPAHGGVAVPIETCLGFPHSSGDILQCPFLGPISDDQQTMDCSYDPEKPRRYADPETKKSDPNCRKSPYLPAKVRPGVMQIFSLALPSVLTGMGSDLGKEWANARANIV